MSDSNRHRRLRGESEQPRILVDERERPSDVPAAIESLGARIEFRLLQIGDYIISSGCGIERKTVKDFFKSLYDGRLFDQAYRLSNIFKFAILIVEGDTDEPLKELKTPRIYWGPVASLQLNYGLHLFYTRDKTQSADLIYSLAKNPPAGIAFKPPLVAKTRPAETMTEAQLLVVQSLPGIGPKLAHQLLKRFGSLNQILGASTTELAIKGRLGRAKAHKIASLLRARYAPVEKEAQERLSA